MKLPIDIWRHIWQYDGTFLHYFSEFILPEIQLLRSRILAADYFDGYSECAPASFRFFQNSIWYTARFRELYYGCYFITLYNEHDGTFCQHVHIPRRYL